MSSSTPRGLVRRTRNAAQNAQSFAAAASQLRAMLERQAAESEGRPEAEIARLERAEVLAAERAASTPTVAASAAAAAAEAAATAAAAAAEAASASAAVAAELSTMGVRTMSLSNFTRPLPRYMVQNLSGRFHNETGQVVSADRVQAAWAAGVPTQPHRLRHFSKTAIVPEHVRTRNARAAAAGSAAASSNGGGGRRKTNRRRQVRKSTRKYRK